MIPNASRSLPRVLVVAAVALALAAPAARARPPAPPSDPVIPMLRRLDQYFERHQTDGVTLDARVAILPTEVIRQSVIAELLGYVELDRAYPERFLQEVRGHADYLVAHFDEVRSGGPFDGMLGYALLGAWERTRDPRDLEKGLEVVTALEALPSSETVLNGGLMAALALAEFHALTGDEQAGRRAREIVASVVPYQNADGSFPHWCVGSEDVSYTDWMSMELILLERMTGDPAIEPMLEGTFRFMDRRIDTAGHTSYEEPCPGIPDCTIWYTSLMTGCGIDYDTRAFTNEPGYSAMLFDHVHSRKAGAVLRFLESLENHGTWPDKWDFWPPPDDPYYVWTISDTSVVNMGVIFWSLAAIFTGHGRPPENAFGPDDQPPAPPAIVVGTGIEPPAPSPARGGCALRFRTAAEGPVSLAVLDVTGRTVRRLVASALAAGPHEVRWDARSDTGARSPAGLYFVRLRAGCDVRTARLLLVR